MKFSFEKIEVPKSVSARDWKNWKWQMRHSPQNYKDFQNHLHLSEDEKRSILKGQEIFAVKTTPYYLKLCQKYPSIRKITIPTTQELNSKSYFYPDPLGEQAHSPASRIIHRYPDRVLFLVTDFCGIYCRYCTRKYFTAQGQSVLTQNEYQNALHYIRKNQGIREVILSGGDPLTLSNSKLKKILEDLRQMDHIEIIRIGSRMPVVCPFRITDEWIQIIKKYQPVYMMTHFNHPKEITYECQEALLKMSDHGICVYNQMVLLSGINNHPAVVQALNRRLLYLRVRPYYMFQCDPSEGTDHFRTTIENSRWIQNELWGVLSGLAVPKLSMDLPGGGGKVEFTPNHLIKKEGGTYFFKGFDGMEASYKNPQFISLPSKEEIKDYIKEWEILTHQPYGPASP